MKISTKIKPSKINSNLSWLLLFLFTFLYIIINMAMIYLTNQEKLSFLISKYSLHGVLAQGQVLLVVLITLLPINKSHWVAVSLCSLTALSAFQRVTSVGAMHALPGIFIPIVSIFICIIIDRAGKRLGQNRKEITLANELLQKVLDTIPMPIFWKDLNSVFLGCNKYFAIEAGKSSPNDIIGRDDFATPSSD